MHYILNTILILGLLTMMGPARGVAAPLTGQTVMLDGTTIDLESYAGKVVLVVNVASRCGFTQQYRALQSL